HRKAENRRLPRARCGLSVLDLEADVHLRLEILSLEANEAVAFRSVEELRGNRVRRFRLLGGVEWVLERRAQTVLRRAGGLLVIAAVEHAIVRQVADDANCRRVVCRPREWQLIFLGGAVGVNDEGEIAWHDVG